MDSAQRPFGELLEELAAPSPSPAAGTACAWTVAVASGLVELAAGVTVARPELADVHPRMREILARVRELRAEAIALGDRDRTSFAAVFEAQRRPGDDPARAEAVAEALASAADAPLGVARAAAEIADLATEVARTGHRAPAGDAAAGALLAKAACTASARIVLMNLSRRRDDPRAVEARALTDQ